MTGWAWRRAKNALAKIATASPEDLRDRINDTGLWPVAVWSAESRRAHAHSGAGAPGDAHRKGACQISYEDEGRQSPPSATIWPVQLAYYEGKQTIAAWCCLRAAFRNFRTDRILSLTITETRYGKRRSVLEKEWRDSWTHPET